METQYDFLTAEEQELDALTERACSNRNEERCRAWHCGGGCCLFCPQMDVWVEQ